jgi:hypothetical protein
LGTLILYRQIGVPRGVYAGNLFSNLWRATKQVIGTVAKVATGLVDVLGAPWDPVGDNPLQIYAVGTRADGELKSRFRAVRIDGGTPYHRLHCPHFDPAHAAWFDHVLVAIPPPDTKDAIISFACSMVVNISGFLADLRAGG